MTEFLVVAGMSGAGRSTAGAALEDLGWFVVDNLPVAMVPQLAELVDGPEAAADRVAVVIGRGGGDQLEDLAPVLSGLRAAGHRVRVLFLDAPDDVLVRRFEGTRRRHPLAARGVQEAIAGERELLESVRAHADIALDTGDLNTNQLRQRVLELFGEAEADSRMQTSVVSFGFKHGVPLDVDLVFDCRFLPNPYWVDHLRPLSGLDEAVRDYVVDRPEATGFLDRVDDLLTSLVPEYEREGKSYLTVGLGCTGGRHRSVALTEALAGRLRSRGVHATPFHRDVDR